MSDSEIDLNEQDISKQKKFVMLLKSKKVLLYKSQLPTIKNKKKEALKTLENEYALSLGTRLTATQLLKKINNMKNEIKKKLTKTPPETKKLF